MLFVDTAASFREVVEAVAGALSELPATECASVYSYEPAIFADAFPTRTVQWQGFEDTGGGSEENPMPDTLSFAVRHYYPVLDHADEGDGLQEAQSRTLAAFSEFYAALSEGRMLEERSLGSPRVLYAGAGSGRTIGVDEGGSTLYLVEADVVVGTH